MATTEQDITQLPTLQVSPVALYAVCQQDIAASVFISDDYPVNPVTHALEELTLLLYISVKHWIDAGMPHYILLSSRDILNVDTLKARFTDEPRLTSLFRTLGACHVQFHVPNVANHGENAAENAPEAPGATEDWFIQHTVLPLVFLAHKPAEQLSEYSIDCSGFLRIANIAGHYTGLIMTERQEDKNA